MALLILFFGLFGLPHQLRYIFVRAPWQAFALSMLAGCGEGSFRASQSALPDTSTAIVAEQVSGACEAVLLVEDEQALRRLRLPGLSCRPTISGFRGWWLPERSFTL